jgi:hypothetical protein
VDEGTCLWRIDILTIRELRAALRIAGKEIRELNFGRKDSEVLKLLRRVLRASREVAKAERERLKLPPARLREKARQCIIFGTYWRCEVG